MPSLCISYLAHEYEITRELKNWPYFEWSVKHWAGMKRQICLTWHFLLFSPDQKCVSDFGNCGWSLSGKAFHKFACRVKPIWGGNSQWGLKEGCTEERRESFLRVWGQIFLCYTLTPAPQPSLSLRPLEESNHLCNHFHNVTSVNMEMEASFLPYHRNDIIILFQKEYFLYWASKGFSVTLTLLDYACKAINGLVHQSMEGFILRRRVLIDRW